MAVEIRELVIKAIVSNDDDTADEQSDDTVISNNKEIIQECVNQVMKILKQTQIR